jgi:hypothetical protein
VVTPSARLRAAHVVLAGNTGLGGLMPKLAATLLPVTTYVAVTAPLGERLAQAVAYSGAVTDTERADNHYRIVDGDRLLWSGGMTTWASDARRFERRLAADIGRTFPQLGSVAIEHVWAGTLGNAVHKMPQIGEISRGLWLASAFGGHGFNTTAMAGELIARGMVEGDQTWRLFAPYDLVWAGGTLGRAAVQLGYWKTRISEVVQARIMLAGQQPTPETAPEPAPSMADSTPVEDPVTAAPAVPAAAPKRKKRKRRKKAKGIAPQEAQADPAQPTGNESESGNSASPEEFRTDTKQTTEGAV